MSKPPDDTKQGTSRKHLQLEILSQPDETTCGPTCLHAVYRYFNVDIALNQLIQEIPALVDGGTLDVFLANHALKNGFQAKIYTYNLNVFDPSWFRAGKPGDSNFLYDQLEQQLSLKPERPRLKIATEGYLEYLRLGGKIYIEDLGSSLIRYYLNREIPILTGLSATYLYRTPREFGPDCKYDALRGDPSGHFVVLAGYDKKNRLVRVADPLADNPMSDGQFYQVNIDRLIGAILIGIVTYDANLLVLTPK